MQPKVPWLQPPPLLLLGPAGCAWRGCASSAAALQAAGCVVCRLPWNAPIIGTIHLARFLTSMPSPPAPSPRLLAAPAGLALAVQLVNDGSCREAASLLDLLLYHHPGNVGAFAARGTARALLGELSGAPVTPLPGLPCLPRHPPVIRLHMAVLLWPPDTISGLPSPSAAPSCVLPVCPRPTYQPLHPATSAGAVEDFSAAIQLEPSFADFYKRRSQALAGAAAPCAAPAAGCVCKRGSCHRCRLPACPSACPAPHGLGFAASFSERECSPVGHCCRRRCSLGTALGEDERAAADVQSAISLSPDAAAKVRRGIRRLPCAACWWRYAYAWTGPK